MNTDHLLLVLDNTDRLDRQLAGNCKLRPAPRKRGRPRKHPLAKRVGMTADDKSLCRQLRAAGMRYEEIRLKMDHLDKLPSVTYVRRVCTGVVT